MTLEESRAYFAHQNVELLIPRKDIVPLPIRRVLHAGFHSGAMVNELKALARRVGAQHLGYGYADEQELVLPVLDDVASRVSRQLCRSRLPAA